LKRNKRTYKYYLNLFKKGLSDKTGGGLGVLLIGLAVIFLVFITFVNIADYSIFTYKRNLASKAMDYAVTAAAQQISENASAGLAVGFDEVTGKKLLEGIEIDIESSVNTFLSIFSKNYKEVVGVDENLLICVISTYKNKLRYSIKVANGSAITGELQETYELEEKINRTIKAYWGTNNDPGLVYLNENPKTNEVEKGTYIFAYLNDLEIKSLYSHRKTSLSYFTGAKIQRE
jgi:hypothetical protein